MADLSPILLMLTPEDEPYLPSLKPLLRGRRVLLITANPDSAGEIELYARSKGCKYIISTNPIVLRQVVSDYSQSKESIDSWAGSLWERNGITFLFINPLRQLYSVPYGNFIAERFISKITKPESWTKTPPFSWEPARTDTIQRWYDLFSKAILIAEDIETRSWDENQENPLDPQSERHTTIRSVAYTGLWEDGNIHTIVLPLHDGAIEELPFWLHWMRKLNLLPVPKVFQNGLYDNWHFVQYHAPVSSYLWDTQSLFHSWYAELPKDLAFINAFCNHNVFYWKDMSKSANQLRQWEYNARDGWATMVSLLALLEEIPDWTIKNHLLKFPLWIPYLDCNLEGFKCSKEQRAILIARDIQAHKLSEERMKKWFGEEFNCRSPKQVVALMAFYGSSDIQSSAEPEVRKFASRHPLNNHFANEIMNNREIGKRISTYLKPHDYSISIKADFSKKDPLIKRGRIYYGINPDGTDNLRSSCGIGPCWTGMQIQNQPRDTNSVKSMQVADSFDWRIFEIDNEKSEAYTSAYTSGSKSYIDTLELDRLGKFDFHRLNASKFFGLKYEEVPNEIREDAAKRIIYGAGYNMQPAQLLRIMGELAVDKAKHLLGFPSYYTRIQVCEILLNAYDKAYPEVRSEGYRATIAKVNTTKKLVNALGWTRYCFGNPNKSKQDFNAYVAHPPANLSVGILNEGFKEGWWKVIRPNSRNIRYKAQIHDSIPGQVRVGFEQLVVDLKKVVQRKVPVTDIHGVIRDLEIPVAAKISKPGGSWADCIKWNGDPAKLPQ